jgi:hypothetical protein
MHDPALVHRVEGVGDLPRDREDLANRDRSAEASRSIRG